MKLYDFAFSPNCRKVRAVFYELGLSFETVHVDLPRGAHQQADYLAINPNVRVPTFVAPDGYVLWESAAIMKYLVARKGGTLVPTEPRALAEMERWLSWQIAHLGPAMTKVAFELIVKKVRGQGTPDAQAIAEGAAEFARLSRILDGALAGREYVAGALSLADFALAAHYSLAPMCALDTKPFPRVEAWLGRMLERSSMKRALEDAHATIKEHAA